MPIYEYICKNCSLEFELLIFSEDIPKCPKCGSENLQKKVSLCSTKFTDNSGDIISSSTNCSSCSSKNCSSCK